MSAVVGRKRSSFFEDHSVPSSSTSSSPPASKRVCCFSSSPIQFSSLARFFAIVSLPCFLIYISRVTNGKVAPLENSPPQKQPAHGAEWVDLFVKEMLSASNMDDARTRASRALEMLEKSLYERVATEGHGLQQEYIMMKEQLQALIQENSLLKRAVAIQHEHQKEFEDRGQEVHNLKQMVFQYQERLRTLEVNIYSLTMHLKQAQQGSSIPGRFHRDVF